MKNQALLECVIVYHTQDNLITMKVQSVLQINKEVTLRPTYQTQSYKVSNYCQRIHDSKSQHDQPFSYWTARGPVWN